MFLVSLMINTLTTLALWVLVHALHMTETMTLSMTMFGPLLARAVTPLFWIYMSPKLRAIVAKLAGRS